MHAGIAIEASGERLLQRLENLERHPAAETPVGLVAAERGFHRDLWFQLGVVHRLNRRAVEINKLCTDTLDVGRLATASVGLVDGEIDASAARVLLDQPFVVISKRAVSPRSEWVLEFWLALLLAQLVLFGTRLSLLLVVGERLEAPLRIW